MTRYSFVDVRLRRLLLTMVTLMTVVGPTAFLSGAEKAGEQVRPFAGSFSYAVPIQVPPFHGLEPKLALSYSSEGRNGFVGVGWNFSGISAIERANPGRGVPYFDGLDIFLLDGQELVTLTAAQTIRPELSLETP